MSINKKIAGKFDYIKRIINQDREKNKKKANKKNQKKQHGCGVWIIIGIIVSLFVTFGILRQDDPTELNKITISNSDNRPFEIAINNYGSQIRDLAIKFNLNENYLMALIMLECSGKADVPSRFEKKIYQKLKEIKNGNRESLENITIKDLEFANDAALKNLASSWGPFQLMGYKCIHLDIQLKELRGENALFWGVHWINETYGDYIRKGKYEDAFHIHNTGSPAPKNKKYFTHNKDYVPNGLMYMQKFNELMR